LQGQTKDRRTHYYCQNSGCGFHSSPPMSLIEESRLEQLRVQSVPFAAILWHSYFLFKDNLA
jgi:hypothetical protein